MEVALYENTSNLSALFPKGFHKDLQTLILQIIEANLPKWRQYCIQNQCSLPRLQSMDWRIDVKRASETISSISVPSVIVELKILDEDSVSSSTSSNVNNNEPQIKIVNFELNKQTLDTMVDGLTKIKQQLASLNK